MLVTHCELIQLNYRAAWQTALGGSVIIIFFACFFVNLSPIFKDQTDGVMAETLIKDEYLLSLLSEFLPLCVGVRVQHHKLLSQGEGNCNKSVVLPSFQTFSTSLSPSPEVPSSSLSKGYIVKY